MGTLPAFRTAAISCNASKPKSNCVAALKDHYEGLGADVILLDAGDFSQGTTLVNHEKGLKAAEYLVTAGYDAISLGNHEFDFGFEALQDLFHNARAYRLCAEQPAFRPYRPPEREQTDPLPRHK